ncbi:MAG: helix-turn-helix transcriptional regulator [Clostridia bacterium]|nr:helix-turn-helix transcriptional regulator [Clostridia bacterium]
MDDYKRIIANNIAELRKAVPITQAELAEKLNYSDKAVSKWERGESIPDVIVLKQISDLFGVTVDYLLEDVHPINAKMQSVPKQIRKNRILITGLSCMLVFLLATFAFVILGLATDLSRIWLAYVYCVPICSIILIVFNSIWGKTKLNFLFISILVWSLLASVYLTFSDYSKWLIFVIGIPAQVIILMWSGIKARIFKKEKNTDK